MSEKENSPSDYEEKVLVVLDKKMNRVDAFTKIGEDNSAERTEATSKNQSRFLRIDERSSMLKNFINN